MRIPESLVLANLVMKYILKKIEGRLPFTVPFLKVENNGTLFFVDMNIIRNKDGSIVTNWYVKPTSSGRCTNYDLNNLISKKIKVFKGLLFRALTLGKLKDKVDKLEQSNLVNKIPCVCDKCYIGQTKQKLKKRLEQHRNICNPTKVQKRHANRGHHNTEDT
ncbi:hypothetical protein M0804_013415 [Polistes exclamans]|nr:hypothetical protein M0804_013415 [Polistes exclamans]